MPIQFSPCSPCCKPIILHPTCCCVGGLPGTLTVTATGDFTAYGATCPNITFIGVDRSFTISHTSATTVGSLSDVADNVWDGYLYDNTLKWRLYLAFYCHPFTGGCAFGLYLVIQHFSSGTWSNYGLDVYFTYQPSEPNLPCSPLLSQFPGSYSSCTIYADINAGARPVKFVITE